MKINQIDTLFDIFTKMDDIFLQEFGYEFNQKYLSKYEIINVRFFLDANVLIYFTIIFVPK